MKVCKYFSEAEFKACSPSCSMQDMDQKMLNMMDAIRARVGRPLTITSAYRSVEWDKAKGRSGVGAHTKGLACDFKVSNGADRMRIVKAALALGIKRIGVASGFVHVDICDTLPQNTIWTY